MLRLVRERSILGRSSENFEFVFSISRLAYSSTSGSYNKVLHNTKICKSLRDSLLISHKILTIRDAKICFLYHKEIFRVLANGALYIEDSACYIRMKIFNHMLLDRHDSFITEYDKKVIFGYGITKIDFRMELYKFLVKYKSMGTFEESIDIINSTNICISFTRILQHRIVFGESKVNVLKRSIFSKENIFDEMIGLKRGTHQKCVYGEDIILQEIDSIIMSSSKEIFFIRAEMLHWHVIGRSFEVSRYASIYRIPFKYDLNDREFYDIFEEFILDSSYRFSISRPICRSYKTFKHRYFIKYYFYLKNNNISLKSTAKRLSRFSSIKDRDHYYIMGYLRILRRYRQFFHKDILGNFLHARTRWSDLCVRTKYKFIRSSTRFIYILITISSTIATYFRILVSRNVKIYTKLLGQKKFFFYKRLLRTLYKCKFIDCIVRIVKRPFVYSSRFKIIGKMKCRNIFSYCFGYRNDTDALRARIEYKKMINELVKFFYFRKGILYDRTKDTYYYKSLMTLYETLVENFERGTQVAHSKLKRSVWGRIWYWFIKEHSKRFRKNWKRFLLGLRIINRYRKCRRYAKEIIKFIKIPKRSMDRFCARLTRPFHFRLMKCIRINLLFKKHYFPENLFYMFAIRRRHSVTKLLTSMCLQRARRVMREYNIYNCNQVVDYLSDRDMIRTCTNRTHIIKTDHMDESFNYFQKYSKNLSRLVNYKRSEKSYWYAFNLPFRQKALSIDEVHQKELKKFLYFYFRRWVRASRIDRIDGMFYFEARWHVRMADRMESIVDEMEACMERFILIRTIIRDYVYDSTRECIIDRFIEEYINISSTAGSDCIRSEDVITGALFILTSYEYIKLVYTKILTDFMYSMEVIYLHHMARHNIQLCSARHYDRILYNSYYEADRVDNRNMQRIHEAIFFIMEHMDQVLRDDYFARNIYPKLYEATTLSLNERVGKCLWQVHKVVSEESTLYTNELLIESECQKYMFIPGSKI